MPRTYNPLTASVRQGCRLEEILLTLQANHVIFLTGTKRPRTHCSPVTHNVLAGYRLFEWGYGMGRGTNRHAGLIVAVKIDLCEIWQIREVASPDASVQGRGGADQNGEVRSFADGALPPSPPPPISDWATDRIYDWADKMVNAAPSRCCIVVGGDLNAHVGYVRHPEREALDLEREVMAGCGEYHQVEANCNGERLAKFCRDHHMAMVNTYYPRGGPTYWDALGGREVTSRLDYILLPATRPQLVKHCFVLRREGRRLQLIPHRRPRDHRLLMIRAKLELLYGGVNMVPQVAVSWDFDGIMSALRDPAQWLPLLMEVEKWSSENIDAILELAKQGRIEKAWTQMADTLNQIARDKFRRTEIKEATTRRRDALRQRQTCREALAATCLMSSQLELAWTTWVAVHRLRLASKCVRLLVQTAASAQRAQLCCESQEAWERRDHSLMWRLARKLGGKKNGPKKRFFNVPSSIRPSSSDWKDFLCGPRENGRCEGVQAKWPPPEPLGLQNESIAESPHLGRELLKRS